MKKEWIIEDGIVLRGDYTEEEVKRIRDSFKRGEYIPNYWDEDIYFTD